MFRPWRLHGQISGTVLALTTSSMSLWTATFLLTTLKLFGTWLYSMAACLRVNQSRTTLPAKWWYKQRFRILCWWLPPVLPHPVPNSTSCLSSIRVPIFRMRLDLSPHNGTTYVQQVLKQGFEVEYEADFELWSSCKASDGTCGSNSTSNDFLCFCGGLLIVDPILRNVQVIVY